MTTDLSTIGNHDQALARLQNRADLIRQTVAPDATDQELTLFFEQCVRLGLDPIIRQAYLIKRKGRATLQVGIDGLRSIAERTGNYVGSDDPVFADDRDGRPLSATVTVWKWVHEQRCPFSATARFAEYTANTEIWSQKPHVMVAKCAEALALRKAFPSQMESAYITEEMDQLDHEPAVVRQASSRPAPAAQASPRPGRAVTPAGPTRTQLEQREVDQLLEGLERDYEDATEQADVKELRDGVKAFWDRLTGAEQANVRKWATAAVERVKAAPASKAAIDRAKAAPAAPDPEPEPVPA